MSVGGFPGLLQNRRRTIPSPQNPMDRSTVVSIYPKVIDEKKPTIQPGRFILNKGSLEHPAILVVGSSSWWKEIDDEQPLLEIPNNSVQVADSIVKDYCNGILGCNMKDCMPGIFWVPGEYTVEEIKTKQFVLLNRAAENQRRFWETLVKLADGLWARTNGSPLCISDDMRMAARELNLNNKDWMQDFHMLEQIRCAACGALRNPEFPVCQTCKAIVDPDKAKALNLTFAQ